MNHSSNDSQRFFAEVFPELPTADALQHRPIIRDLVLKIHASIEQWNTVHLKGVDLIKTITLLKVDESYPKELENPCEELENVCDVVDQVVENLKQLLIQMKALGSLYKTDNIVFATWPVNKFGETTELVYEEYKKEAKVKRIILENVAHGFNETWKVMHLAAWTHQVEISDRTKYLLNVMLYETELG